MAPTPLPCMAISSCMKISQSLPHVYASMHPLSILPFPLLSMGIHVWEILLLSIWLWPWDPFLYVVAHIHTPQCHINHNIMSDVAHDHPLALMRVDSPMHTGTVP